MITEQEYIEAFDRGIKDRGGRFDVDQLKAEEQTLFLNLKENAQSLIDSLRFLPEEAMGDRMPHVHFDLIDNSEFNAVAFAYEGKEFIGFNYGLILVLLDTFSRMLARKDILPEIGSIEAEENPDPLPYITINFDDLKAITDSEGFSPTIAPKDPFRHQHAYDLTYFAIYLLLYHEICHLRQGHIQYAYKLSGHAFIAEFDAKIDKKLDPLTNKVLEIMADSWSASSCVFMVQQMIEQDFFRHIGERYESIERGVFFNWGFSIWVLFRLMDAARPHSGIWYPTPRLRQNNALAMAMGALNDTKAKFGFDYDCSVIEKQISEILYYAEKAVTQISNTENKYKEAYDFQVDIIINQANSYMPEYTEHCKNVVWPALLPLTRDIDIPLLSYGKD